jgi:hypothetical protein
VSSVYQVNKGVDKAVEFKGLKAQYIWYAGAGLVIILICFAILYLVRVNTLICLMFAGTAGTLLFFKLFQLSKTHGEYGLMKKIARRYIPTTIKMHSRKVFQLAKNKA